ncbi:MAG: hypothetical protein N2691_01775 [Patescibacteria group bacterium]|nr:hypothetical protein [Patescibacteria group bacterium]
MKFKIATFLTLLAILAATIFNSILLIVLYQFLINQAAKTTKENDINSFAECAARYPVLEKYPAQCQTPDGRTFTNPDSPLIPMPVSEEATGSASQSGNPEIEGQPLPPKEDPTIPSQVDPTAPAR